MYQDVMFGLCSQKYEFKKAVLNGYQRMCLVHRTYPGLVAAKNQSVEGIVYLGVKQQDTEYLHQYQHEYDPIHVEVKTEDGKVIKALAYLYKTYEKTTKEIWDPKEYEKKHRN